MKCCSALTLAAILAVAGAASSSDESEERTTNSCGKIPILVGREDAAAPRQLEGSYVYQVEEQLLDYQLAYLLNRAKGGVMVHFNSEEDDNEDYANKTTIHYFSNLFSGWLNFGRGDIPGLAQRDVVAFAKASIGILDGGSHLIPVPFPRGKDSITCLVMDYQKTSPSSMCTTTWWSCEGEKTLHDLNNRVSRYALEEEPMSDRGVVDAGNIDDIRKNASAVFVRYGQEWEPPTKRSNSDWEIIAKAVLWNDMDVEMVRADCTETGSCTGMNATLPRFRLYVRGDVVDFSADAYFEDWDQTYSYPMIKNMFKFLQNHTEWTPVDCNALEAIGLPIWTPCETKASDIQEPVMVEHLYQVEDKGHLMFLMQNFEITIVHFTDHVNEASTNLILPLLQGLALEHQDIVDHNVVAFAVAETLPETVGQDLQELYLNGTLDYEDDWYAVDRCTINYGMEFWSGCMIGGYDAIAKDNLKFECQTGNAPLGWENSCENIEEEEIPELEESLQWHISIARMEVEPKSDLGPLTDVQLNDLLASNETVFVRYGLNYDSNTKRTNEAWELLAQAVQKSEALSRVKVARVNCGGLTPLTVCKDIYSYPAYLLYYQGTQRVFRPTRSNDEISKSERLAKAMLDFLLKEFNEALET